MYMASRISKMIRDTNKFLRSRTAIKEMKIRYVVGGYSTVDHLLLLSFALSFVRYFSLPSHMRSTDSDHVPYDIYSNKAAELIELFFLPRFVWGRRLFGNKAYSKPLICQ